MNKKTLFSFLFVLSILLTSCSSGAASPSSTPTSIPLPPTTLKDLAILLGSHSPSLFFPFSAAAEIELGSSKNSVDSPLGSPDGKRIAFIDGAIFGDNSIRIINVDDQNLTEIPNTTTERFNVIAAWSPDGNTLALTTENNRVFFLNVNDKVFQEITLYPPCIRLVGFHNVNRVFCLDNKNSLYSIDPSAADGAPQKIIDLVESITIEDVVISPKGDMIAYSDHRGVDLQAGTVNDNYIHFVSIEGSTINDDMYNKSGCFFYNLVWSLDGSALAFTGECRAGIEISVMQVPNFRDISTISFSDAPLSLVWIK